MTSQRESRTFQSSSATYMKSLSKYALLTALLTAAVVEAQTAAPLPKPLTAGEMKLRVEAISKDIEADHRHVLHLQATVRKEKDVIKLTCVNDKLVQIKAQMNLFENATLQLESAVSDETSTQAAFAEVEKAGSDVHRLRGEADGCAGELEMYKQESKSDVDRPVLDDPTDGDPFHPPEVMGDPEVDVPATASPYF